MGEGSEALRAKAKETYDLLLKTYGHHPNVPRREPMHELLSTILSHRTTQKNEDIAYRRMMARYGSFEAVRDADVLELARTLEPANYPEQKAPRLKEVLRRILAEHGGDTKLEFLRKLPLEEALSWLRALPGVGPKTASLVLLFCFARPVLPVDTHVHRVSQRVGLIGPKVSQEAAHKVLLELLPKDPQYLYNFHINALLHGQQICIFSTPRCQRCPLTGICDYYQTTYGKKGGAAQPKKISAGRISASKVKKAPARKRK
jgi:endonuclease III